MYTHFVSTMLAAVTVFTLQLSIEFLFPTVTGFNGWLLYAFLIGRILGVYHPPTLNEEPLNLKRKVLGWLALAIFVLCFTPEVVKVHEIY